MGSYKEQSKEKNITLIRLVQCPPYKEYVENIWVFSHLKWLHVYCACMHSDLSLESPIFTDLPPISAGILHWLQ
jgi:hypothetical protein